MKKLAMALACLVSVAFFASCTQETPNPTISVASQEGFIQNNDVVDVPSVKKFGFNVAAELNGKDLTKLYVTVSDGDTTITWADLDLTALAATRSYAYVDSLELRRDIIGHVNINAVVTDAAGKTATASIAIDVNEPAQPLIARTFEWRRDNGADGTGLESFGLEWKTNNSKETYAVIKPLNGAVLYRFENSEVWTNTTTDVEKAALFSELGEGIAQFKEISTTAANKDYDIVIGTIYNGENHLIHITHSTAYERGWHFTITGEAK
jgi:hypothetical protein